MIELFPPFWEAKLYFKSPASGYPGSRRPDICCSPVETVCVIDFSRGKTSPVACTYVVHKYNFHKGLDLSGHKHVFAFSLKPMGLCILRFHTCKFFARLYPKPLCVEGFCFSIFLIFIFFKSGLAYGPYVGKLQSSAVQEDILSSSLQLHCTLGSIETFSLWTPETSDSKLVQPWIM